MGEVRRTRSALIQGRADRQAGAIRAALRARGVDDEVLATVEPAVALAMKGRLTLLADDHHPAFLHPGRSVLILLHDVADLPEETLPLAALHESRDVELRPARDEVILALGVEMESRIAGLPLPGSDRLMERLVILERDDALAVLAEQLDHLRHLHMRPDTEDQWSTVHAEVEQVWLPFSQRTDAKLARRFAHWARTFGRRLR